jgi:hypothetical protein
LPARNEADLEEVPDEVLQALQFIFVETIEEVLEAALEPVAIPSNPTETREAGNEQPSSVSAEPVPEQANQETLP